MGTIPPHCGRGLAAAGRAVLLRALCRTERFRRGCSATVAGTYFLTEVQRLDERFRQGKGLWISLILSTTRSWCWDCPHQHTSWLLPGKAVPHEALLEPDALGCGVERGGLSKGWWS